MERTFAFARTEGGIILSGPKACLGSTKDAKILLHFLHSAVERYVLAAVCRASEVERMVAYTP